MNDWHAIEERSDYPLSREAAFRHPGRVSPDLIEHDRTMPRAWRLPRIPVLRRWDD